jgi:hypothetical protein
MERDEGVEELRELATSLLKDGGRQMLMRMSGMKRKSRRRFIRLTVTGKGRYKAGSWRSLAFSQ